MSQELSHFIVSRKNDTKRMLNNSISSIEQSLQTTLFDKQTTNIINQPIKDSISSIFSEEDLDELYDMKYELI